MSKHFGPLPSYTCPDIDKIIEMLEELRKDNDTLRTAAEEAREAYHDLDRGKDQEVRYMEEKLAAAEARVAELEKELADKESTDG